MEPISHNGLVALVVAVSGHLDIADEAIPKVRAEVREYLKELTNRYPHSPILIASGVAEGGDQLVVEVVRGMRAEGFDRISCMAVLPMPRDIYLEGFSAAAREIFTEQIGEMAVVTLPIQRGHTLAQVKVSGSDERRRQYALLADTLVKSSQILLALWDGQDSQKQGGTSEAVARKLGTYKSTDEEIELEHHDRHREAYRLAVHPLGVGPVRHIATRRKSSEGEVKRHESVLIPKGTKVGEFERINQLLDEYNRDVLKHPGLKGRVKKRFERMIGRGTQSASSDAMTWCVWVRSWSTVLADHYKEASTRAWQTIFVCFGVAGVMLHLCEPLSDAHPKELTWDAGVYLGAAAVAYLVWLYEGGWVEHLRRKVTATHPGKSSHDLPAYALRFRRKHEDYRALSEALRVQFYWLAESMEALACESYLNKHAGDMIWVRDATSEVVLRRHQHTAQTKEDMSRDVGKEWINGQVHFFRNSLEKHEQKNRTAKRRWWWLAIPTLLMPIVLIMVERITHGLPKVVPMLLTLVPALLLIVGVLLWNFAELMGYEQEAQQYKQMMRYFTAAGQKLETEHAELKKLKSSETRDPVAVTKKKHEIQDFLWHVGKDALTENGDWLALHRGRDLKLNHGGG